MRPPPRQQTRTRIVCTIGRLHGDSRPEMITAFHDAGMDVARVNMSHCDPDYGKEGEVLSWARDIGLPDQGTRIATLGDLQGPKIRLGQVAREHGILPDGEELLLRRQDVSTDEGVLPIPAPLADAVFEAMAAAIEESGAPVGLTLGDGDALLEVLEVGDGEARARIAEGGPVRSRMGFTARGISIELESFTEKDRRDLAFLLAEDVTFIGVSFVKTGEDLRRIRCYIRDELGIDRPVSLLAKVETAEAVHNIHGIIAQADAIMVARGDLGLHIDIEEVPEVQKRLSSLCRVAAKPVIIATQMLESMTQNPEPTRAEVTDVFNAIVDGCDAVMLSGETSYGDHPLRAIEVMDRIASRAELWRDSQRMESDSRHLLNLVHEEHGLNDDFQNARLNDEIAHAVHQLAEGIESQLIATITSTGASPRRITRYRSRIPIVAAGEDPRVMRELILAHGTHPIVMPTNDKRPFEDRVRDFTDRMKSLGWVEAGDVLVLAGGQRPWPKGSTNLLKVLIVE